MIPERLNKVHIILCILAAFVLTAGFLINRLLGYPFAEFTMALWVSLVIVVFYIFGLIVRQFLISSVFMIGVENGIEEPGETEGAIDITGSMDNGMPDGTMAYDFSMGSMGDTDLDSFGDDL